MTSKAVADGRILGSLRSADGKGVVRMEDRFDTDIDDVWSALTDPARLARWYGEVEGDLRLGGEYRARLFSSGWEGTGRVEVCEPPQRLLVRHQGCRRAGRGRYRGCADAPTPTRPSWSGRNGACPWTCSPLTAPGCRFMSKISPTTSPGVSGATTPRHGGTSFTLPTRTWPLTSARKPSPASGDIHERWRIQRSLPSDCSKLQRPVFRHRVSR